jgi:ribonuclease P protein component
VTVVSAPAGEDRPGVGLIAGKRVGGAVQRNRAKRRIRHALDRLRLPGGTDIVVIASREVLTADFQDLVDGLRSAIGEQE